MDAHFGREPVVTFRITLRFVYTKLDTEYNVEVHTEGQMLDREQAFFDLQAPGDIVLLQGKCQLGAIGLILGQDPQ